MKKIHTTVLAVAALLLLTVTTVFAQKAPAKATSTIIRIDKKGGIHDHGGTLLGHIGKNNIVRNIKGETIYFIDKDGNVIDAKGNKLGKAKKNGFYLNNNGETILTVKDKGAEECEILDPQGHNLGTTHKNYKLHACAAHCLFLKEKNTPRPIN
ncbi:5-fold beta-flower protein [Mucilaginibacter sp.]|jgi:hypothetical protein|uniref:5-fold beta-flower protein n=1 Tax=Mucilaginibacter sp. TaxID=1882438 RepID=UPI00356929E3